MVAAGWLNSPNILVGGVVTRDVMNYLRRPLALVMALGLALAGCGSSASPIETSTESLPATDAGAPSPQAAADANLPLLQAADDARDHEILDVTDGSISSLRDAVDGDRPVLIWFWAPH